MNTLLHTTFNLFDTTNTIVAACEQALLDEAVALCKRFHALLSIGDTGSDIYRINQANGSTVQIDTHTAAVLASALEVAELSGGAFNPAIGKASTLWDYRDSTKALPSQEALDHALELIDWKRIKLEGTTVQIPASMRLDLGGIAKGYIADKVSDFLRERGCISAKLDFGGNIVLIGGHPEGRPWRIGLQLPGAKRNQGCWAYVDQCDGTVVTSGTYERGYEKDGKRCHHLIDPHSGRPSNSGIATVTLFGTSSCYADAISTACFIVGPKEGILLATQSGFSVAYLMSDGSYELSQGCPITIGVFKT